jgi:hypothetical protein
VRVARIPADAEQVELVRDGDVREAARARGTEARARPGRPAKLCEVLLAEAGGVCRAFGSVRAPDFAEGLRAEDIYIYKDGRIEADLPFAHARLRGSAPSLCFVFRSERPIENFFVRRMFSET